MSSIRFAVMLALAKEPAIGYKIIDQIVTDNGLYGIYIMPDTIYKSLARLEVLGWAESHPEPHTKLKVYTLTKQGHLLVRGEVFRLENSVRIGRNRLI